MPKTLQWALQNRCLENPPERKAAGIVTGHRIPACNYTGMKLGTNGQSTRKPDQAFAGIPSTSASGVRSSVISKMESSFVTLRVSCT